jgi:hypothetical protein
MTTWHRQHVAFNFQLGEFIFFTTSLPVEMRSVDLAENMPPVETLVPPAGPLLDDIQGYCVRALPVAREFSPISTVDAYLCYVSLTYRHCFIDLGRSFAEYEAKFSSKTRSTIRRKIKKYAEYCGGRIPWKTYSSPTEMNEFYWHARQVSRTTYQEKLLNAGLPDSTSFESEMRALAEQERVRGYILFEGTRPVSYLYCPSVDNVLTYGHLGYDPELSRFSVGTVLQWLAIEQLFNERRFRFFDFTEGESPHKRLFATQERLCVNVMFLRRSVRNWMLVRGHHGMNQISKSMGNMLERMGVKAKVKRLLRSSS